MQVGILLERSIEMIVSMLGVLKAGGAYVPLDPQYPEERLAFMIDDTSARVLITQEHLRRRLNDWAVHLVVVEEQGWSDESVENPAVSIDEENLAYLIYTSGLYRCAEGRGYRASQCRGVDSLGCREFQSRRPRGCAGVHVNLF